MILLNIVVREMNYNDLEVCSRISIKTRIDLWEKYDHTIYPRRYLEEELKLYKPTFLEKFVDDEDKLAFVAEAEGMIVGLLLAKITYGILDVSWVAVDLGWQGKGIGKRLLEAVMKHSKKRGCHKMVAYTTPIAVATVSFYLKMGFVPECYLRSHWRKVDFIMMSKFIEP